MLEISVNGESKQLAAPTQLAEALPLWGYRVHYFAVAVNGDFVPRSQYANVQLKGGDQLEILSPRQGG